MNFEYRPAQRDAICRCCDKWITKHELMVSGYSYANKGQHIHFHANCVLEMAKLINKDAIAAIP